MGLLTPGDRSTWTLLPVIAASGVRLRPHMAALIENMELHRTEHSDAISADGESSRASEVAETVIESAA